jgi:hypothetical protein
VAFRTSYKFRNGTFCTSNQRYFVYLTSDYVEGPVVGVQIEGYEDSADEEIESLVGSLDGIDIDERIINRALDKATR